jgi:hypothetical protein
MAATAYADPRTFIAAPAAAPSAASRRSIFGDAALLLFLLSQCFDGVFTYVGVVSFGSGIEANPLIAAMMAHLGHGVALVGAKTLAALLGCALHVRQVHGAVAALALFYLAVAVVPWMAILFSW